MINTTDNVELSEARAIENEYVAPQVEMVMTEEALAREVKYAGDGISLQQA